MVIINYNLLIENYIIAWFNSYFIQVIKMKLIYLFLFNLIINFNYSLLNSMNTPIEDIIFTLILCCGDY